MKANVTQIALAWAKRQDFPVFYQTQVDSTNTWAASDAFGPNMDPQVLLSLYLCEHQTQGKGRFDRHWEDVGSGAQLLCTFCLFRQSPPQPVLSCQIGLALFSAAKATWPQLPWALKAPNDLFLGGKKIAGILIESVAMGHDHRVLIGIGFNFFAHPSLPHATSLNKHTDETDRQVSKVEFFLDCLKKNILAATRSENHSLSAAECSALLVALNLLFPEKPSYQKIHPDGSMDTTEGRIEWRNL